MEILGSLKPAFKEDGVVTAGNSSQITDGAAALLITSPERARELGWEPKARFVSFSLAGTNPVTMLTARFRRPTRLARAGLSIDDIDLFEVNEAFASVIGAWLADTGADWAEDQRQRRCHCPGPSVGCQRSPSDDDAGPRARAIGRPLWAADDVRGRRTANGTIIENLT